MATFKAIVRFKRPDGYYPVYIRVTHQRKAVYIKTDKIVDQKGIDKSKSIKDPFVLQFCANRISRYVDILNKQDISAHPPADFVLLERKKFFIQLTI